ncbi:hypothetical protein [Williamsia sp. D3]|uniref:hypothetical protein n=1 Tax=Williamsia sp. D3 TaxID=1313067 RepID=UPI0003D2BC12|nr:hypothetical protein [Williamsia sp. D3]ETD30860.1 hypothetical protein W823_22330 [Williamsia sp. D3]PZU02671.1 MAG: hypothetical protein DI630_07300 [Gordonia sp. (in: high G+C Gram-positive bacteria)]
MPVRARAMAAVVVAAVAMGGAGALAGPAFADPEQGGVTSEPAPEQGGVIAEPTPPVPAPAPEPVPDYGPGILPSPQWETEPVIYTEPSGPPSTPYTPLPQSAPAAPAPAPAPAAPIAPILVKDPAAEIRAGNVVFDRPDAVSPEVAITVNEYMAYFEAEAAQYFESIGFPRDEAARRAAAAAAGAGVGGLAGALAAGIPTAIFFGIVGGVGGGIVGSFVPPTPFNILPGIGIGAGAGAALGFAAGAAAGGSAGALAGGLLGWALGFGDPNANPAAPWAPAPPPPPAPLPNPEGDQYQLVLDAPAASDAGLPAVDYTVDTEGDVSFSANVAGIPPINVGWSAEQAEAPLQALGPLEQPAKDAIAGATKQIGDGLTSVIDGLHIAYPQTQPAQ